MENIGIFSLIVLFVLMGCQGPESETKGEVNTNSSKVEEKEERSNKDKEENEKKDREEKKTEETTDEKVEKDSAHGKIIADKEKGEFVAILDDVSFMDAENFGIEEELVSYNTR